MDSGAVQIDRPVDSYSAAIQVREYRERALPAPPQLGRLPRPDAH